MGTFDKIRDLAETHDDQLDTGIDKAADLADERSGGQHRDHIDAAAEELKGLTGNENPTSPNEP